VTPRRAPSVPRSLLVPLAALLCLATLLSAGLSPAAGEGASVPGLSRAETLRLGERIYRGGILSSGEPLTAVVQGDIPVEGTMFSCVSCHLRSGLGSFEGDILTPPTNGDILYQPWDSHIETARLRRGTMEGTSKQRKRTLFYLTRIGEFPSRPAYTDETLADAIREGADPEGRDFIGVMPRYPFGDREMAILIEYLKSLSKDPSPGVTDTTIRFATVVSGEVSRKERDELLVPLDRYVRIYNGHLRRKTRKSTGARAEEVVRLLPADSEPRLVSLVVWELQGSPETWRGQLEEYYRKEPVFALLSGITTKEWRPVHEFCEENAIPSLLPITDLPVVSETGWYTLYFSKGYYQEGETAARHLARTEAPVSGGPVVQVYPDTPEGNAFASGFRDAWNEGGRAPLLEKALPAGTQATREILEEATGKGRRSVLVLWTGAEAIPALNAMTGGDGGVSTIYMSATLLKEGLLAVPEALRDKTYITYPYGLTDTGPGMMYAKKKVTPQITDRRVPGKAAAIYPVLTEIFSWLESNYFRDYMFDIVDASMLVVASPFERITFGPGQRYASKGCYIVQLSKGERPELVRKSGWVVH
jgi:hypothetical protein